MSCGESMLSLILAGGRSRRMGRDKALIEIDGISCVARVAIALAEAGLEPIRIAVANPENIDDYGATIPKEINVEWVLDANPHAGPIEAILEALSDPMLEANELQITPVDVPWVTSELFTTLADTIADDDALAVPADGERMHPLLALIRPTPVRELLANDRRPLRIQFTEMPHSILLENRAVLKNINLPIDLE